MPFAVACAIFHYLDWGEGRMRDIFLTNINISGRSRGLEVAKYPELLYLVVVSVPRQNFRRDPCLKTPR